MKLELKHIAPYLPYGLKVEHTYFGISEPEKSIDSISAISSEWVSFDNSCDYYFNDSEPECDIKPILRPLSDLTKEITVNGEKFVPIVELLKIKYPNQPNSGRYSEIEISSGGYPSAWYTYSANRSIMVREIDIKSTSFWIVEKLFSWHFDLYGLIPFGLAIDINTIEKV